MTPHIIDSREGVVRFKAYQQLADGVQLLPAVALLIRSSAQSWLGPRERDRERTEYCSRLQLILLTGCGSIATPVVAQVTNLTKHHSQSVFADTYSAVLQASIASTEVRVCTVLRSPCKTLGRNESNGFSLDAAVR